MNKEMNSAVHEQVKCLMACFIVGLLSFVKREYYGSKNHHAVSPSSTSEHTFMKSGMNVVPIQTTPMWYFLISYSK
jgi:hypothetical protein